MTDKKLKSIVDRIEMKRQELRFVGNAQKPALLAEKPPNPELSVSWQDGDPNGI